LASPKGTIYGNGRDDNPLRLCSLISKRDEKVYSERELLPHFELCEAVKNCWDRHAEERKVREAKTKLRKDRMDK
jgi:hypothetical protein